MKKIVCILVVLLVFAGCAKEKTHEELVKEALSSRDRTACLMESDEMLKESENARGYILKASCFSIPGEGFTVNPLKDRDEAYSLIKTALEKDPSLQEEADEVFTNVNTFLNTIEDIGTYTLKEMSEKEESFKVSAENFWLDELPSSHSSEKHESENIETEEGNEIYHFVYYDDLGRAYWQTHGYWTKGHNYVCEDYTYSVFDHDYFPCTRKDYTYGNDESYREFAPHGLGDYIQYNDINVYEYDENGEIVNSYSYIYENGQITKADQPKDHTPF